METIEERLTALLDSAASSLKLKNYTLNLNLNVQKGDGFLGELYKVSILDETNTTTHLVVKVAPDNEARRAETCIENAYKNEIYFYTTVIPTLTKFQKERGISRIFDSVPTCFATVNELGKEMLALEDITNQGYQLRNKKLLLDDTHVRFVLQAYGRFHALSFCFKDQKPEQYCQLSKQCQNIMEEFTKKKGFSEALQKLAVRALEALDPKQNGVIIEKFRKYAENTINMMRDIITYEGEYSGILHGDCWSNNFMFKYQNDEEESNLEDVKLLDFQLIWVGSPVYDLSYFFYSGGSKVLFDKLEEYLDVYYESFSSFAKNLGNDPATLFPREKLTDDWKKYSTFGMLWAILLTQIKLISKESSVEMMDNLGTNKNNWVNILVNKKVFDERVRNLILHMYEIDAL